MSQRVVWSEGLHVQQQHFQQLERSIDHRLNRLSKLGNEWAWGFLDFVLDSNAMNNGKFGLASASGLFQDGSFFDITDNATVLLSLDIPDNASDLEVCLCVPSEVLNRPSYAYENDGHTAARFRVISKTVHDVFDINQRVDIDVAVENLQLRFSKDIGSGFEKLPVARVSKQTGSLIVQTSENFIPALLTCFHPFVKACQTQLLNMFRLRAGNLQDAIAGQKGGMAGVTEFLMLQTVNRYLPFLEQLQQRPRMPFYEFYFACQQILGDLQVFSNKNQNRMIKKVPLYRHENPYVCLRELMIVLGDLFGEVVDRSAIRIDLTSQAGGRLVATVQDVALFDSARFVLAVKSAIGEERVRSRLPSQIKVAAVDTIASLLNSHSAGIPISPLSVVPSQIPFHSGFTYFEFEQTDFFWKDLAVNGALAIDPPGDFSEIEVELWAIKE